MSEFPNNFDHWNLNIGIHLELGIWLWVLDLAYLKYQYPGHFGN